MTIAANDLATNKVNEFKNTYIENMCKKYNNLKKGRAENPFLESVCNKHAAHLEDILQNKRDQVEHLNVLCDYIQNISNLDTSSRSTARNIKHDQKMLLQKINELKKVIKKICKTIH